MVNDRLISSRAVDSTAGKVISKGIHWEPDKKIVQAHSETPFPTMRPYPGEKDLSGNLFGRFTVIGKYQRPRDERGKDKGAKWVVRCCCGRYCLRSSKSIHNPANNEDRCDECRQLAFIKRREQELRNERR